MVDYPVIGLGVASPDMTQAPTPAPIVHDPFITSFDIGAFDTNIEAHGVPLLHYRAMRCPIGMIDTSGARRVHVDHAGCSNGMFYTLAGELKGILTSGSGEKTRTDLGHTTESSMGMTSSRFYSDGKTPTYLSFYDRLYTPDQNVVDVNWQLFTKSDTNIDKLQYPAEHVIDMMDSDGRIFVFGRDFVLEGGRIKWTTMTPPDTDKVCSTRYLYRPYWYISSQPHGIRIARADGANGEAIVQRMPQSCRLVREYIFEAENAPSLDGRVPANERSAPSPPNAFIPAPR